MTMARVFVVIFASRAVVVNSNLSREEALWVELGGSEQKKKGGGRPPFFFVHYPLVESRLRPHAPLVHPSSLRPSGGTEKDQSEIDACLDCVLLFFQWLGVHPLNCLFICTSSKEIRSRVILRSILRLLDCLGRDSNKFHIFDLLSIPATVNIDQRRLWSELKQDLLLVTAMSFEPLSLRR